MMVFVQKEEIILRSSEHLYSILFDPNLSAAQSMTNVRARLSVAGRK